MCWTARVVDRTGLAGRHDFNLEWTPDEAHVDRARVGDPPPATTGTVPPDLFTAMRQQLGLNLEATKAMVDVLVIDHVERPSEN